MDKVQIDVTARHAAYEYYDNSDWTRVVDFLEQTGLERDEAMEFIITHRRLILQYRDELIDWLETPLREGWPR